MNPGISKSFYFVLLSIVLIAPRFTHAQTSVNFDVDVSVSSYKIIKTLVLPGNKTGILIGSSNYSNVYLWVYNSSGTRITNTEITSLITWPSSERLYTEFNAIVTNSGNIFITITAADADLKLTDYALFIIISETGALQTSGQVNSTDPGNSLTRFIQLANLSDGKIVVVFQRTDNYTYAFRIFNENGTAFSANDVVYAGPGTANPFGSDPVQGSRVGAFKNGNFLVSFDYFDATLRGILFDNSGNTILVGGSGSFDIDGTVASEYNGNAIVSLANSNMAIFWRIGNTSYFKILSSTGGTIQNRQVIAGGQYLGNFIPDNTPGSEGFMATQYTYQDPGDLWGNPYMSYSVNEYDQTGVLQNTTALQGYLIRPTYYFAPHSSGGYAYVYSYYKSYSVSDGEYTLTSDTDIKGTMSGFNSGALPVNLVSFTITLTRNQTAQLNWSTTSETNSKNFEIEKSLDGRNFVLIASVGAAVNSTAISSYSFTDPQSIKQKSWYRLKQIDIDGREKNLGIRLVNPIRTGMSASVYPNPVIGNIITVNTGDERLPVSYRISNIQGKIMKKGTLQHPEEQLDVQYLAEGIYFLQIGQNQLIKLKK